MLSSSLSILLLSGLVAHSVVFHIVVANLLLNNSAVMMLIFPMLEWMSRTLSTLSVPMSIILLSGLVAELVVLHILVANFVVKISSHFIVVVAVGSSTASESDVELELTESDVVAQLLLMSPRWPP